MEPLGWISPGACQDSKVMGVSSVAETYIPPLDRSKDNRHGTSCPVFIKISDASFIKNRYSTYGDLALDRPLARGHLDHPPVHSHRSIRLRYGVCSQRGVRFRPSLPLRGVCELGREKAENGQIERHLRRKSSAKQRSILHGADADSQTRLLDQESPVS
jgi:hypothetical protein